MDYTEFSGNRVGLIINGTVVVAEPLSASADRIGLLDPTP
jgi:hypothetical protein